MLGKPHSSEALTVKVLGVIWNPQEDRLYFRVADVAEAAATVEPIKRNVVSIVGRFYDPLGFLAPVIIRFKKLFQKLCEQQLQWDEPLPESLQGEWRILMEDLQNSGVVSIPRSYHEGIVEDVSSYTLCGFYDASTTAYAAVVYLVMETERCPHPVPHCQDQGFTHADPHHSTAGVTLGAVAVKIDHHCVWSSGTHLA